ncbi:MAG TPA: NADP-dependent isocitrate dehydrogenase [Candidatus Baltobacteraceae bacterium]|jgi:isocitrate dehydrogenase|nr:NADP-dependent isocitrate dehydrogenase [Candidatus Baltobacteraceae bacterium]
MTSTIATAKKVPITVAYGDGIGPEIMDATVRIITEAGAALDIERIDIGESIYNRGLQSGIEPNAWDSLRRTKVFLKAPITTPQGGGFKSLNVTVRKTLGMYANVRPCASLAPYVATKHPKMNLVIVRENEEDVYGGIEHRQTAAVTQCLKLISRPGSERIVRYAFEYARANKRKKVTCFTKDNIMKITDGLFHRVFDEIAAEYPDIENEHWIVDIGAAKMADTPEAFDVIVMPNLYGDVLSDVAAQITGSVGLAGSANIGDHCSMFEAIHGSAPRRAGQNLANPSGLLHGGILMLVHIGQGKIAERVHNAWLKTIEDGIHTYDIYKDGVSKQKVGTREFADAIIARLGQEPHNLAAVRYADDAHMDISERASGPAPAKERVGVDVFIDKPSGNPDEIAAHMQRAAVDGTKLTVIANRGTKVWPQGNPDTFWSDHWSCRFEADGARFTTQKIVQLLGEIDKAGFDVVKTEGLFTFDGERGYSLAQGQ